MLWWIHPSVWWRQEHSPMCWWKQAKVFSRWLLTWICYSLMPDFSILLEYFTLIHYNILQYINKHFPLLSLIFLCFSCLWYYIQSHLKIEVLALSFEKICPSYIKVTFEYIPKFNFSTTRTDPEEVGVVSFHMVVWESRLNHYLRNWCYAQFWQRIWSNINIKLWYIPAPVAHIFFMKL